MLDTFVGWILGVEVGYSRCNLDTRIGGWIIALEVGYSHCHLDNRAGTRIIVLELGYSQCNSDTENYPSSLQLVTRIHKSIQITHTPPGGKL